MKGHWILVVAVAAVAASLPAQESIKRKQTSTALSQSIVTAGEVQKVAARCENAICKVLGLKLGQAPPAPKDPAKPAKREMVLDRFDRLFELAKSNFKFNPRPLPFDKSVLKPPVARQKKILEKLVGWGCVSSAGVLATSNKDSMTLQQFGEATGLLMVRIAELTHTPDSKYSPYLNGGG